MAIKKQYLKSKPICKVTFIVDEKEANEVVVVGAFNNWDTEATSLKKLTLIIPTGPPEDP